MCALACGKAPRRSSSPPILRAAVWSVAVVITSLDDLHFLRVCTVDQSVLVVDAARPVAGQVAFEGLGFAYALEGVALDLADQAGDPGRHFRSAPSQYRKSSQASGSK